MAPERLVPTASTEVVMKDPEWSRRLFRTTQFVWLWAMLRIYLGWQWAAAGWGKVQSPAWVESGVAVRGFWERAVAVPEDGPPAIAFDWYRSILQNLLDAGAYSWLAPLIAWGELLVGAALILGALTGIAAFFGALMNWNFMMAGTASTNPLMFVIAILLIMGWRVAGIWGLDAWLLPRLGTPWSRVTISKATGETDEDAPGDEP